MYARNTCSGPNSSFLRLPIFAACFQSRLSVPRAARRSLATEAPLKATRLVASESPQKYADFAETATRSPLLRKSLSKVRTKISKKASPNSGLSSAEMATRARMLAPVDAEAIFRANATRFTEPRKEADKPVRRQLSFCKSRHALSHDIVNLARSGTEEQILTRSSPSMMQDSLLRSARPNAWRRNSFRKQ